MAEAAKLKITIGLPVHNGEHFLANAIEAILGQTLKEFELIICDTGSTDGTERICREYAAQDGRVRYYRSERNQGASRNFNWTFDFASADYFKWINHDDVPAPDLLERCVAALDAAPDAVLCRPEAGAPDRPGGDGAGLPAGLGSGGPTGRFAAAVLARDTMHEVFGVIRASVLVGTCLHGGFPACERALVAELALRGRFVAAPGGTAVDHPERRRRAAQRSAAGTAWHDPTRARWVALPLWRLYREYFRIVRRQLTRTGPRLRCYLHLLRWLLADRNGMRLAGELGAGLVLPRLGGLVTALRARLFGPAVPSLAGGGKPGSSTH